MDDPSDPAESQRAKRDDLSAIAREQQDAVWGEEDGARGRGAPGMDALLGQVGPKGTIDSQLRGITRTQRGADREVPFGTAVPGTGRYLLLLIVGTIAVVGVLLFLLGWLAV